MHFSKSIDNYGFVQKVPKHYPDEKKRNYLVAPLRYQNVVFVTAGTKTYLILTK